MVGFGKLLIDTLSANPNDVIPFDPTQPLEANASKGDRNKNQGNLEDGPFAKSQPGYMGSDGRFAKFDTAENGAKAQERLLEKNYGGMTPAAVVKKYAPRSDNSEASMRNYIGYISGRLGIDPDQPVPPERRKEFASAMREFETGKTQKIKFNPYGGTIEGGGPGASGMAGTTPIAPRDVTQERATANEKAGMQGPYAGIQNPFDPSVQAGIKGATSEVQKRAGLADSILQASIQGQTAIRQESLQELDATTAAKRELYEHGKETTRALIDASTPIFQQRKQIQDRKAEIAKMNPFVAMVKGVIDPDYNSDSLSSRDNILRGDQQLLDEEYTHQGNLHNKLIEYTTAESNDQQTLYQAQINSFDADTKLALQSFESGGMLLSAAMQPFATDSALLAAKNQQTGQWLDSASDGMINEALALADQNGGVAEVNGVQIPKARLIAAQDERVQGAYHMASMQAGLAQQNEALVVQGQKNFLRTASLPTIQQALANGGVIDGVQFDLTDLNTRFAQLKEGNAQQAEDAVLQSVPGQFKAVVDNYAQSQRGYSARLTSMFGQLPDTFATQFKSQTVQLAQIASQVRALNQAGNKDAALQLIQSTTASVQKMIEQRDSAVAGMVDKWSGGNADLKVLGTAWATGQSVEPGAAMRGLIYMARNGAPAGMKFAGTSAKIFGEIANQTRSWDAKQVGDDKLKGTSGDRDNALIQQIQGSLGRIFNSDIIDQTLIDAPTTAKSVMLNGRVHPFSMVSREMMQTSIREGDERGWQLLAQETGLGDAAAAKTMMGQGENGPMWKQLAPTLPPEKQKLSFWKDFLQTGQAQGMYESLDRMRTDAMPFAPSTMLKDLMGRPQFRDSALRAGQLQEGVTMGSFATAAAAGGSIQNATDNFVQRGVIAHGAYRAQQTKSIGDKGRALRSQPLARTSFILATLPGISTDEEKYLLNYIKQVVPSSGNGTGAALATTGESPTSIAGGSFEADSWGEDQWSRIGSVIGSKMEDPRAEAIRKKVAPKWQEYSDSADKVSKSPWYGGNH